MTASAAPRPAVRARRGLPVVAALGVLLSVVGVLTLVVSGLGYHAGAWTLPTAFRVLVIGGWIAAGGGVVSLLAAALTRPGTARRGFVLSVLGVLVGLGGFAFMVDWDMTTRSAPAIGDLTTDFDNPPTFTAIGPSTGGAPSPGTYGGAAAAAAQRAAYPAIGPAELPGIPPAVAFRLALAAARRMGWNIVNSDSAAGRFEATATTPWFGFTDDIAVRVTAITQGSRVDVRSVSGVGQADANVNASRIRRFLARIEQAVGVQSSGD